LPVVGGSIKPLDARRNNDDLHGSLRNRRELIAQTFTLLVQTVHRRDGSVALLLDVVIAGTASRSVLKLSSLLLLRIFTALWSGSYPCVILDAAGPGRVRGFFGKK